MPYAPIASGRTGAGCLGWGCGITAGLLFGIPILTTLVFFVAWTMQRYPVVVAIVCAGFAAAAIAIVRARKRRQPRATTMFGRPRLPVPFDQQLANAEDPAALLWDMCWQSRAGAFLGLAGPTRAWVTADRERAVLVLGPPRSGKTSAVVIPSVLSACGPVVSTSTKVDVLSATISVRARLGSVWIFDPSGSEPVPALSRRLRWSPVRPGRRWDATMLTAAAMVHAASDGTRSSEDAHWHERAGSLLACLLQAAAVRGLTIAAVRRWVLRNDLAEPQMYLQKAGEDLASDIVEGLVRTADRELSGIFSTTARVLSAYNSQAALDNCADPNFDVDSFVRSRDTLYITVPAHVQGVMAPLIVGLLEEIRDACYRRQRQEPGAYPPVVWALDEVANIAPLKSLPSIVSEGGGQGLHVMACFQDLAQARERWGQQASGFLSLFGTKMIFSGIGDYETLRAISTMIGTWDRPYGSTTQNWSQSRSGVSGSTATQGLAFSASTQREALLPEGEIAALPPGHGLMLGPQGWTLLALTPHYSTVCWQRVMRPIGPRDSI